MSFTSNPDDAFDDTLGTTTDTGSQVRNLVGFNPFGPVAINSSVRIGTITFHKELSPASATLTTLFTATDSIGGLTSPSSHGRAFINEFHTDECSLDKKCSIGGDPPQDACTAKPGEEVTYTYEFTAGCGLVIDDKLGVIGDSNGETLSATTTLTGERCHHRSRRSIHSVRPRPTV